MKAVLKGALCKFYSHLVVKFDFAFKRIYAPSLSYYLTVVEGFACPNDPQELRCRGLYAPGRVTHGKQVRGEGPDKRWLKRPL